MMRKKYKFLDPLFIRLPGCRLFETLVGKKDGETNQLCELDEGHITPEIEKKINGYSSHINKVVLKTVEELDPMIQEANSLIVELNVLLSYRDPVVVGEGEEAKRQTALAAAKRTKVTERKTAILTKMAKIKAESDLVDEMLLHYEERAEGILHSHISKYWRGLLSVSSERLEHFPYIDHKESPGMNAYHENREKLLAMIDKAIYIGGGVYNEEYEEYEEAVCG